LISWSLRALFGVNVDGVVRIGRDEITRCGASFGADGFDTDYLPDRFDT
jgi:hypothetical protein